MKSQIYLTALGLVLATSALGFATVGTYQLSRARDRANSGFPAGGRRRAAPHPLL